jgi:hypothetical protein
MPIELLSLLKVDFRLFLPATKARRVQAAVATIASRIAASTLEKAELAAIDAEIVRIYKPLGLYPWWNLRAEGVNLDCNACERAIAMWRLGMATVVPGKSWSDLLHPWHQRSVSQLIQDFRPYHKDTDEALVWLSSLGVHLPADLHYGHRWLAKARANDARIEA